MTSGRPSFRLTQAFSNKLRHRFTRYFRIYYKTLRQEINNALAEGVAYDAIPHYYKGYKKVEITLCRDGVVVSHWPADEGAKKLGRQSLLE